MAIQSKHESAFSREHLRLLFYAVGGWIRTVRGDTPSFGHSTSSARRSGTIYREFWQPSPGSGAVIKELIDRGFLFWGVNRISVGLTRQTVHFLDNSDVLNRLNPVFAEFWSKVYQECTPVEFETAMIGAELLSYRRDLPAIVPGQAAAHEYHRFVAECIGQLFYPRLTDPVIEHRLNDGAKRVDIVLTNSATEGFFHRIALQGVPCPFIFVECKNYSTDPDNPAIDQLIGRLSNNRGRLGLLFCRRISAREEALARCRRALYDNESYILALDDDDLSALLSSRADAGHKGLDHELTVRFRDLVS